MASLSSVAIRLLLIISVRLFGSNTVLGVNASSNATKVCCPPFDKRVELNGTVFCFATVSIPNDRATIGNYLCRNLNPHANLASFHSSAELSAVYSLGLPTLTGLVYEFDEFSWRDGTPVDFTQWYSYQPSMNSSEAVVEVNVYGSFSTVTLGNATNRKAFCKMKAEDTECSECETCILRKTDQNLFCYRLTSIGGYFLKTLQDAYEFNTCARYPGYEIASVHSKEENEFIFQHFSKIATPILLIGLHIPRSKENSSKAHHLFEWTDGTPVDYTDWEEDNSTIIKRGFSPNQYELYTCRNSGMPTSYAWIMKRNGHWCTGWYGGGDRDVICKKRVKCYTKW